MLTRFAVYTVLVATLILCGCKNDGELKGQIFMVDSYQELTIFALVEVRAIPEERILTYIKRKEAEIHSRKEDETYNDYQRLGLYFSELPIGTAKATTDSDGRFSMRLPTKGRFALCAKSSRPVPMLNIEMHNYWFVWVSLEDSDSKNIILSNNNITPRISSESVLNALARPY